MVLLVSVKYSLDFEDSVPQKKSKDIDKILLDISFSKILLESISPITFNFFNVAHITFLLDTIIIVTHEFKKDPTGNKLEIIKSLYNYIYSLMFRKPLQRYYYLWLGLRWVFRGGWSWTCPGPSVFISWSFKKLVLQKQVRN